MINSFKAFLKESPIIVNSLLSEAQRENMSGNINDSEKKGLRHLRNYVMPTLSKEQRKKVTANFARYMKPDEFKNEHGENYNEDKKSTTHTLASAHGAHEAGTAVRVTGARHDDQGRILLSTEQHGEIPQSKLAPPKELKKAPITKGGFDVEGRIAKNFGTASAGSTGTAIDFVSHDEGKGQKAKKKLSGVVKQISEEAPKEQIKTPFSRIEGESKLDRGKMGQSAANFDQKSRTWKFTHPTLAKSLSKVKVGGKPILQYLNENHSNGVIENGFSTDAPKGTTRAYLESSKVNALHIHNKDKDKGTTFTIGNNNDLKGVTTLGHLDDKDLDRLDGKINIAATQSGKTQVIHRPKHAVMKEYSNLSETKPELHRDVSQADHAQEVKKLLDKHNKENA